MSTRKLPPGNAAFEYWLSLGENRTLRAVAQHYDVAPAAVTRLAHRQQWGLLLQQQVEPQVQAKAMEAIVTTLAEFRVKQVQVGAELVRRGLAALERLEIRETAQALAAVKLGAELQSKAFDAPAKKVEISVEHTLRERFERFIENAPKQKPRPQITVDFGQLEDGLTPEDIEQVEKEAESDDQ